MNFMIKGDPTRLNQVLINLINNAIKFSPGGKVTVGYEQKNLSGDQVQFLIYVKDTGVGISEEKMEHIFSPFSQADSSTTREFGGTGLGLSICRKLVSLMGGEIWCESQEGKGTVFYLDLTFPMVEQEVPHPQMTKSKERGVRQLDHRVLVAEDTPVNQKIIGLLFKKLGLNFDVADNGKKALEMVEKNTQRPYSLIFMDMQMPELDGVQTTILLKQRLGDKCPPIIALTANAFVSDKKKCEEAGMVDFLTKPIEKKKITEVLERYSVQSFKTAS